MNQRFNTCCPVMCIPPFPTINHVRGEGVHLCYMGRRGRKGGHMRKLNRGGWRRGRIKGDLKREWRGGDHTRGRSGGVRRSGGCLDRGLGLGGGPQSGGTDLRVEVKAAFPGSGCRHTAHCHCTSENSREINLFMICRRGFIWLSAIVVYLQFSVPASTWYTKLTMCSLQIEYLEG